MGKAPKFKNRFVQRPSKASHEPRCPMTFAKNDKPLFQRRLRWRKKLCTLLVTRPEF
jgi:hypothetical protein